MGRLTLTPCHNPINQSDLFCGSRAPPLHRRGGAAHVFPCLPPDASLHGKCSRRCPKLEPEASSDASRGRGSRYVLSFDGSFRSRSFWMMSSISTGTHTSPSGVLVTSAISTRLPPYPFSSSAPPDPKLSVEPESVPWRDLCPGRSVRSSSECELEVWLEVP